MATIETRRNTGGTTSYRARVRLKGRPPYTKTFKRKTDAKKWANALEADLDRSKYVPSPELTKRTLADLIDRYIDNYLPVKANNQDSKKTAALLLWWRDHIGRYSLANLTPAIIAEQRDILASGTTYRGTRRSKSTVNRYLAALSHVLKIASREWHWIERSPMESVGRYSESTGRVRFLSDDERRQLLEACQQSREGSLYAIVVLALSTGMRHAEIVNLSVGDVDAERGFITLGKTKNKSVRVVPLVGKAHELIKARIQGNTQPDDLIFPSVRNSQKPIYTRVVFEDAVKAAGIKNFTFHDLRHSAASYLAMNGASPSEIAAVLGHKTLQMVKRYSHIADQHSANVLKSMNERLFSETI